MKSQRKNQTGYSRAAIWTGLAMLVVIVVGVLAFVGLPESITGITPAVASNNTTSRTDEPPDNSAEADTKSKGEDVATSASAPSVLIDGFRSAKFGMTKDQVKQAIESDFKLDADDVHLGENSIERTTNMSVMVPELLNDGGQAKVSYVFGYESDDLIQVGVAWSKATDESMTTQQLLDNARVLRHHFVGEGYEPDSVRINIPVKNGVLAFRGEDAKGHATVLLLQGQFSKVKVKDTDKTQKVFKPAALVLIYSQNPAHPDVFQMQEGRF